MFRKKTVISKLLSTFFVLAILITSVSSVFMATAVSKATVLFEVGGGGLLYLEHSQLTKPKKIYTAFQNNLDVGLDFHLTVDEDYFGDSFMYWYDMKNKKVLSYEKSFDITNVNGIFLRAEFSSALDGNYIARYFNNAGNLIKNYEIASGTLVTAPQAPKLPGFNFVKWDKTPESFRYCTDYVIIKPIYTPIPVSYNVQFVNCAGCTGEGLYPGYSVAKVSAPETDSSGKAFSYWIDANSNEIVSYYRRYSFYINKDISLTAVYGETVTGHAVATRITGTVIDSENQKLTFYAERSVAPEFTIIKHGILVTKAKYVVDEPSLFNINALPSVVLMGSGKTYERVGTYSLTKNNIVAGDIWYARSFVIYRDSSGTMHSAYSSITTGDTI